MAALHYMGRLSGLSLDRVIERCRNRPRFYRASLGFVQSHVRKYYLIDHSI